MKRFIQKFLLFTIPLIIILVSVNYFGDAAKIFSTGYIKEIAGILKSGKYVTNISNYDERFFKKEVINNFVKSPDILVIGSSRTMLINTSYFKNQSLFNNSVSSASLEDLIAIYQLYKQKNIFPKTIILAVDPWIFNKNNERGRWQSLRKEYNSFFVDKKFRVASPIIDKAYFQLLSPSYFQNSLKNIPDFIMGSDKPIPTLEKYNTTSTILTDGSIVYSKAFRNASNVEVEKMIKLYLTGDVYSIEHFNSLSPRLIEMFNLLVTDMKTHNIKIAFFLAPYHPEVYQVIEKKYPMVINTENYIAAYAKKNKIQVYGSYNPLKLGLNASHFYDGMHSKEIAIRKILNL